MIIMVKTKPCLCKMIMLSGTITLSILSSQLRTDTTLGRKTRLERASTRTTSISSRNPTQKLKMERLPRISQVRTKIINQKAMANRWLRKTTQITLSLKMGAMRRKWLICTAFRLWQIATKNS